MITNTNHSSFLSFNNEDVFSNEVISSESSQVPKVKSECTEQDSRHMRMSAINKLMKNFSYSEDHFWRVADSNTLNPSSQLEKFDQKEGEVKSDANMFNWTTGPVSLIHRMEQAIKKRYMTVEEANFLANEYCIAYPFSNVDRKEFYIPVSVRHTKFNISPEALANLLGERGADHSLSLSLMLQILEKIKSNQFAEPGKHQKFFVIRKNNKEHVVKIVLAKNENQAYLYVLTMYYISASQFKNENGFFSDIQLERALKNLPCIDVDGSSLEENNNNNNNSISHSSNTSSLKNKIKKTSSNISKERSKNLKHNCYEITSIFDPEPLDSPIAASKQNFKRSEAKESRKKAAMQMTVNSIESSSITKKIKPSQRDSIMSSQENPIELAPQKDLIGPDLSKIERSQTENQHINTEKIEKLFLQSQLPTEKGSCHQQILKIGIFVSVLFAAGYFFLPHQE